MPRLTTIKILGGTRAQLDAAKAANQLIAREPYIITDENKLAVGTAVNNYVDIGGLQYWKEIGSTAATPDIFEAKDLAGSAKGIVIRKAGIAGTTAFSKGILIVVDTSQASPLGTSANSVLIGATASQIADGAYNVMIGGSGHNMHSGGWYGAVIGGRNHNLGDSSYYSAIVGGDQNTIRMAAYSTSVLGGFNNTIWSSSKSVIIGGEYNAIGRSNTSAVVDNSIINGKYNDLQSSNFSQIINGLYNRINGVQHGTIINGERNVLGGNYSSILGGRMNEAFGESSAVVGGKSNSAVGFASSAFGAGARAIRPGQMAWSNTQQLFGTKPWTGQGQGSHYTMTAHTIGDVTYQMALGDALSLFNLEPRTIIQFDIQLTAFSIDHEAATFRRMLTIKRADTLESTTLVGSVETLGTDTIEAALDGIEVHIDADTTRGGLSFSVRGKALKELQWTANLTTVETKI